MLVLCLRSRRHELIDQLNSTVFYLRVLNLVDEELNLRKGAIDNSKRAFWAGFVGLRERVVEVMRHRALLGAWREFRVLSGGKDSRREGRDVRGWRHSEVRNDIELNSLRSPLRNSPSNSCFQYPRVRMGHPDSHLTQSAELVAATTLMRYHTGDAHEPALEA